MRTPQGGIFALGTASHAYLEFDAVPGCAPGEVVAAIAALREPRTTMGGVNLVAGFRPRLWAEVVRFLVVSAATARTAGSDPLAGTTSCRSAGYPFTA